MKALLLQLIYTPVVNKLLRNILLPFSIFLKKPLVSISGKLKIKTKETQFTLQTNQTCSVTQDIFYHGADNYEFTWLFSPLIKNSSVFFDIGANIGYFTILSVKLNPSIQTFSFEPSLGPLSYLRQNIILNKMTDQIKVIDKAVSDIDGVLTFYDVINPKYPWLQHNLNGSNSLQNQHGKHKDTSYPVHVSTLQSIVDQHNLKAVDLIKLDTECTEHLILESSKELINQLRPIIICEVYPVIYKETESVLQKLSDYSIFQILPKKLILIQNFTEVQSNEHNYIFCPKEKTEFLRQIEADNQE